MPTARLVYTHSCPRRCHPVALSSLATIFGRVFDFSFPACAFDFFFLCGDWLAQTSSTLYVRISLQWLSELRRVWPNIPRQIASELISRYVPTLCLDSGIVSPLRLPWVEGVCVFRCNLPPAFFQNDRGLLSAIAVPRGWNRHRIRVSTQS